MHVAVRHNLQVFDPADPSPREAAAIVLPIREAQAVLGETVVAYLARVAWRFDLPTVCRINGAFYGRDEWADRALAVNDNVEFVSRPLGGGSSGGSAGKSILSVVALVALTAVAGPAGFVGSALTTSLGATLGAVASAAIVGVGALAISHFLGGKAGGKSAATEQLYSFGFQGNAARPMQPIPVLNGRLRFAPDYAAPTYSEYAGDAMTDYALYALTCGRMRPEQVLIGDTPIWDYQTGYSPDYPGIELQFVEPGAQVTLYPVNVVTADELTGAELSTTFTPGYIVNAAGTRAKQLLLDFVWPGGAYRTNKDKIGRADTHILVRIRTVDAAGAPTGPWQEVFGKIYSATKQSQIRITERITVAPGRYEVSARRVNAAVSDGGGTDAVTWTALRAHIDGPQSFPGVSVMAVKGVASKQLSGVSGGQLRVIGTRILPVWKNGQFVEEPTRSIAWAALDWWRNDRYAAGLSITDVDFQAFVAYDALWASLGNTFDHRFSEVQNLDDVLETVLKAGRAFPAPVGDKLTITRDEPRGLSRMLFTENDIVAGSLEIDYALSDEAWADGIVGEYVDQSTWRLAEVSSAPEGTVLLKPARVQIQGVVDRKQALGVVRQMAAESQYRRITVAWIARMEGRLLKRGDLVKITAEEPETWGQSAEVVAVSPDGLSLTLDPPPTWNASGNHFVEIRRRDGRPWGPARVTRGGSDAIAVVAPGSDASGLADALARTATQERPWLAFSPGQPRTFPVLITEGDPDQDGEHIHLTGVIDATEVYSTTESGVPPLLQIPDLFSSALPVIIGLAARITQRQLVLTLTAGWQPARNAISYVADVSYDAGATWIRAYEGDRSEFEATVGGSDQMRVRVAGVTPSGARGAFFIVEVAAPSITVPGGLIDPLSVEIDKLSAQTQADIASINDLGKGLLAIDQATGNPVLDLAHDTIRGGLRQVEEMMFLFANADATQATNIYNLTQTVKVGDDANFAAIRRVDEARITDRESVATITAGIGSRLTTAEGGITGNATAIQSLGTSVTAVDGRVTAQSQNITALSSRIDASDLKLSGQATAVQGLTTRVGSTESGILSIAQSVTSLQSSVGTQGGQVAANAQAISTLSTQTTSIDGRVEAQATALTSLRSTVTDQAGQISANAQAASQLSTRATDLEGKASAQASSLQALQTTVGGHTSTLTTYGTSIDGVKVQFGVTGDIDGQTGGFVFNGVRKLDGSVAYSFNIRGDALVDGTLRARALRANDITSTQLTTDRLIVNGQLFDAAATQVAASVSTGTSVGVGAALRGSGKVVVLAFFKGNSGSGSNAAPGQFIISRDGAGDLEVVNASFALFKPDSGALQYYPGSMCIAAIEAPGAGNFVYSCRHTNAQGIGGVKIVVMELSK